MSFLNRWFSDIANWLFKNNWSNHRKVVLSAFNQNFSLLKDVLIERIPYLKNLGRKDWDKIKNNYYNRLNILYETKSETECFIDIAIAACGKNYRIADENRKRLEALNELIDYFVSHPISKQYPKKVRDKIRALFDIVIDPQKKDSPFKNSLHELLFLRYILESDSEYKEIILEEKLPNGGDVDFVMITKEGERIGFEIETAQSFKSSEVSSSEDICTYFNNRAKKKAENKLKNCIEINYDKFYIVIFVEIKQDMGNLVFPEKYGEGVIVLCPQYYYNEGGHYQIVTPNEGIKDLKQDDPTFFKS